jgi:thiol-disulfide isomerase/thioredoxin
MSVGYLSLASCTLLQWCGFCKRLKDTWIELATEVKGKAKIGAVDCTQHKALCSKHGIQGYPTLKKFGADKTKPEEYEGDRSVGDLTSFATGEKAAGKADAPKEDEFYAGTGEKPRKSICF